MLLSGTKLGSGFSPLFFWMLKSRAAIPETIGATNLVPLFMATPPPGAAAVILSPGGKMLWSKEWRPVDEDNWQPSFLSAATRRTPFFAQRRMAFVNHLKKPGRLGPGIWERRRVRG